MSLYCTLVELKARLGINDVDDDPNLEDIIQAVSRKIDDHAQDRFYTTAADETRYFSAQYTDLLKIDEQAPVRSLVSVTTLQTDEDGDRTYERTWAATDYDLEPFNSVLDSKPYRRIRVTPNGQYTFPLNRKGVKIVGKFGWTTTPTQVREACLLQSARLFKRKDAPLGIYGNAEIGELRVVKLDPDVIDLLEPFKLVSFGVI